MCSFFSDVTPHLNPNDSILSGDGPESCDEAVEKLAVAVEGAFCVELG
jgi:hypothetical protein